MRTLQLLLLTVGATAAVYAKVALGPLQETLQAALGLSDNQIALLQGPALAFPMLLAAIPLGLAVDRHSRVRLVFLLMILLLCGSLLTALSAGFPMLFVARAMVGLAVFALLPAVLSLLADLYEPAQRGRASMVILIGQFGGLSAAFALGGYLAAKFGVDGWRYAMFWTTSPVLIVLTLLTLRLREPPRTEQIMSNPSLRDSLREIWRHRGVITPILVGKILALIALGSIMIWGAPIFSRVFVLTPDRVGAIMAVVLPAGGIAGTVAGGFLADLCQRKGGPRLTLSVVMLLMFVSAPAGLFALIPNIIPATAVLVVLLAIVTATSVMAATLLMIAIPNEIRGLCIGVLSGIGAFVSIGLAPLVVSWVSAALGGPSMLGQAMAWTCVTGSLLSTATFVFGRRHFPRAMPV